MPTVSLPTVYTCPGEKHPISRSVHLSRLAAFYPKCRDCQHRDDTGNLPQQTVERLQNTEKRVERPTLFTDDGVRGIYLNELNRNRAGRMSAAFASLLWDGYPLQGRDTTEKPTNGCVRHPRPVVVVGYDARPSSPDIATGVVTALRRMGCHVVDINLTTRPCFCFAVDHLKATGGIFVTGAGSDPSWTGLDFLGRHACPISRDSGLENIEGQIRLGFSRPTRQAGPHRIFQATLPYEAVLWKHFHALRPLRIVCGCPIRLQRETLTKIFEKLPCSLQFADVHHRSRDLTNAEDQDIRQVAHTVMQRDAHLGVVIDDDGCLCAFVDERGRLIDSNSITVLIAELLLSEQRSASFAIESSAADVKPVIQSLRGQCHDIGTTLSEAYRAVNDSNCVLAAGTSGRFWFRESIPTCDAILTVARMLEVLSQSDTCVSELVDGIRSFDGS